MILRWKRKNNVYAKRYYSLKSKWKINRSLKLNIIRGILKIIKLITNIRRKSIYLSKDGFWVIWEIIIRFRDRYKIEQNINLNYIKKYRLFH